MRLFVFFSKHLIKIPVNMWNHLLIKNILYKSFFQRNRRNNSWDWFVCAPIHNETKTKSKHNSSTKNLVYKNVDILEFRNLINGQTVTVENIQKILEQYEYLKYITGHVPSHLTIGQMKDLLSMDQENQRKQFLRYLFLTEIRKRKDQSKLERKRLQNQNYVDERAHRTFGIFDQDGQLSYRLWGNSLVSRISAQNVSSVRTKMRSRFASMFGQKLVIDLDYDQFMSLNECRIQVRHIVQLMVENLHAPEPFDIYFTNCDSNQPTMKNLRKYFDQNPLKMMPLESHFLAKSYMDVFPAEKLVYLTPDAKQTITSYDHDDIYIIGGFLDKSSLNKPISHLKATREGIRQYRLPLEQHVVWAPGSSKHLCIMHMVAILNQVKLTQNWAQALKDNIPKRKQKNWEIVQQEQKLRQIAYTRRKLSIESNHVHHDSNNVDIRI